MLKDESTARRYAALTALAQADRSAKNILPHVRPLLKDKELSLRVWAARASWKIGGEAEPAVAVLTAVLQDKEATMWHNTVVFFLGEMGPDAKGVVPALTALLKESPPSLRMQVITALRKIDPESARKAEAP